MDNQTYRREGGTMKRKLALLMAGVITMAALLSGCGKQARYPNTDLKLKDLKLQNIAYENIEFGTDDINKYIGLELDEQEYSGGRRQVQTGKSFSITLKDSSDPTTQKEVFFLVDWGDGSWTYEGLVYNNIGLSIRHTYRKPGTYFIRAMSIEVRTGRHSDFCKPYQLTAVGDEIQGNYISTVKAIGSESESEEHRMENIVDGKDTYWQAKPSNLAAAEQYVGLRLDSHYRLDTVEIKLPKDCEVFPKNLAIEYTTDGGGTWYHLPKYYYREKHKENGRITFAPNMNFPNLAGATLVLDLDGIVANGIRIAAKLYDNKYPEKYFAVEEMRVTGDKQQLYYSSYGDRFDADLNNMYTIYGTAQSEISLSGLYWGDSKDPFAGGSPIMTVTDWYEWDEMQIIWTDHRKILETFTGRLFETKIGKDTWGNDGYIWQDPGQPLHFQHQAHYSLNSIFIIATRDYMMQRNNKADVLKITNSQYLTMEERLDKAMAYLLGPLHGEDGLIIIEDPKNDGTFTGNGSSYWDAYTCDGYKSTYVNILFYAALNAMADIETYRGNPDKAAYYTDLAAKTRDNINATFWDKEKGRYIMSIDVNGDKHDYGTTYMNMSAVAYGVATKEQAEQIYSWLDGDRIIEGDTSTGEDIYGKWKYAARANTVDVSTIGPPYCWETWGDGASDAVGALDPRPGGNAEYGTNIQNGGNIFYTSYYDVMGRIKQLGVDNGMERFEDILDEFHEDLLRRRYIASIATAEGVVGEFPESGIVPLVFQNGVIGLETRADALSVTPNLPSDMEFAGIREYHYNGNQYDIQVSKKVKKPTMEQDGETWRVKLPADGSYRITLDNTIETV